MSINNKLSYILGEVESILDHRKEHKNFSLYKFLTQMHAPAKIAAAIENYYIPLQEELASIESDKDIKEAYSCYTKPELKAYTTFVGNIIADANRYMGAHKKTRKPRKRKIRSAESKIKTLKYLTESSTFKVKSVDPVNIIGAMEIWLFDTTQSKLTVLRGDSLDIKGTTVIGFDPEKSYSKRIGRKTQETIDELVKGTKARSTVVFNQIASKASIATGRVNESVILLRVYK